MRILFVARSLLHGGAERQLTTLAAGLRARGHDVAIATFYDANPLAAALGGSGVELHVIGKRGRWDVPGFFGRLVRFVRAWRPDVIHPYLSTQNILLTMIKPLLPRVPLVWGVRSAEGDLARYERLTRLVYANEGRFARFADAIIANSEAGRRHGIASGFPAGKITVIPNGIDGATFHPDARKRASMRAEWSAPEAARLVGIVARFDPMKDHDTFLRAAAIVAARSAEDVRFVLIGTGAQPALAALANELGIGGRVRMLPAGGDIVAMYNALDVVVSSSYTFEGFSNAVAEAMACGTPCVVTDVGDSRLIAGDDRFVVPARNPDLLAGAVLLLLAVLPERRGKVRERIVTEFSVEKLVERTEKVLLALCRSHDRSHGRSPMRGRP
ncbi:MAG: putative Lipopolysaccharide core biosynthesis glycosyltransferase [Acidobacteria bacterium]|nr:putative Lipopolysaccharide core biosynthesis glycosyltransferase [Acidobacteriota bacterium]